MRDENSQHLRFAAFELDPANEVLRKGSVVVKLPPQPFKVLTMLASRPGQLVRREELYRAIWGDEMVVDFERGLNTCMRQIRTALGEEAGSPQFIETVPRLGYRFVAPLDSATAVPPSRGPASSGKRGLWWAAALALTALFATPVAMNVAGVRDRIVSETGGNPLALLELTRGLTPAERAGGCATLAFPYGAARSSA